jgi:hypothetical protein
VGTAAIERLAYRDGSLPHLSIEPHNPLSRSLDVLGEQALIVQLGDIGGRWELGYRDADLRLARELISAVVDGRVQERSAWGRESVTVTLEDGSKVTETGYDGCLPSLVPLPGWRRWGRTTVFQRYR